MKLHLDHIPFDKFISFLKANGFQLGVDTHLKLNQLLNSLNDDIDVHRLKYLLSPLFASRSEEQERFYTLFDKFFEHEEKLESIETSVKNEIKPTNKKKTRSWLIYLIGIFLAVIASLFWRINNCSCNDWSFQSMKDCVMETCPVVDGFTPDTNDRITTDTTTSVASDSIAYHSSIDIPEFSFEKVGLQEEDVSNFEVMVYSNGTSWSRPLVIGLFVGFVGVGFLFNQQRKRKKRKILQDDALKSPPYNFSLEIDVEGIQLFNSRLFFDAAKSLKNRLQGDQQILDVNASIGATISAGGFPTFVHSTNTKQPEYLILIERLSDNDALYQYYVKLIHELERQEIFIQAYYFKNDFNTVFHIDTERAATFDELEVKYNERRLLIISDSEKLMSMRSGEIDPTILNNLGTWDQVGVLTTKNISSWGYTELKINQYFPIVPANLEGVVDLIDQFEQEIKRNPGFWMSNTSELRAVNFEADKLSLQLTSYLGEKNFQLLCTTASYPEISWSTTIKLAEKLAINYGIYSENDLLKILSLPWFRNGEMPEPVRLELLSHLKNENDIHKYLIELIEFNEPEENSYAHDQYEAKLLVQKLYLAQSKKEKKQIYDRLDELSGSGELQSPILKRFVKSDLKSKFGFFVSSSLENYNPISAAKVKKRRYRNALVIILLTIGFFVLPGVEGSMPLGMHAHPEISPQTNQDSAHYYNFNGINKFYNDDFDGALKDFKSAVDIDSNFMPAYFNTIEAYSEIGEVDSVRTLTDQLEYVVGNETMLKYYIQNYEEDTNQVFDLIERLVFNRSIIEYRSENYSEAITWYQEFVEAKSIQDEELTASDKYYEDILYLKSTLNNYKQNKIGDDFKIDVKYFDHIIELLNTQPIKVIDQENLKQLLIKIDLYVDGEAQKKVREILQLLKSTIGSYNIDNLQLIVQLPINTDDRLTKNLETWIKTNESKVDYRIRRLSNVKHSEVLFIRHHKDVKRDSIRVLRMLLNSTGESRKVVLKKDSSLEINEFVIDLTIDDDFDKTTKPDFVIGDWYENNGELTWSYRITENVIDPDNKDHLIVDVSKNKESGIYRFICEVEGKYDAFYIVKNNKEITISWNKKQYESIQSLIEKDEIIEGKTYSNLRSSGASEQTELPAFLAGNWYNEEGTWMWGIRGTSIQHGNKMYTVRKVKSLGTIYKVIVTNEGNYHLFVFNKLSSSAIQANWGHGPFKNESAALAYRNFGSFPIYSKSGVSSSDQKTDPY